MKRRGRVGEHDDAAASEDDPAVGRRPGEELGELGAQVPLIEIHALDRLSREHRRRPRQTADEPARTPGLLAGRGQRRRERAVEERHAQRICDARRDLVTSSSMFGRHRDDGEASRRRRGGIHPWQRARTEAGQTGLPPGRCPWGLHGPRLVARTHERRAVMSPRCTRAYTNEFNARRRRRGDRRWGGWRLLCSGAGAARGLGCATRAGRGPGVGVLCGQRRDRGAEPCAAAREPGGRSGWDAMDVAAGQSLLRSAEPRHRPVARPIHGQRDARTGAAITLGIAWPRDS